MRHVVIFARAPALGAVKTRLAHDIGALAALRFYRATLKQTVRRLSADPRWTTWLAVTPDRTIHDLYWPAGVPCLPQGSGDLGRRMKRALEAPPRGPVLVIGADIPALNSRHVARAFTALSTADFVFGPATDGGYWLVGARRLRPLPRTLFRDVRWSTEHALGDSLGTISARTYALADTLSDVDDGAAYAACQSAISSPAMISLRTSVVPAPISNSLVAR